MRERVQFSPEMLAAGIDPITFEVIRGALQAVCNEIGVVLAKGALSMVINQGRDFSAAVLTPTGDLVMQGEDDFPNFTVIQPLSTKAILEEIPAASMREGDVYICNDPYRGGTHKPDVRMCRPVFFEGELVAFVSNSGHWPDVGGQSPGSFPVDACDIIAEGFCIPPLKIAENDEIVAAVERLILANVRLPVITRGDMRAMVSSLRTGERRLLEHFERYGKDVLSAVMQENIRYSERLLRAAIRELPEGEYSWADYIDEDPGKPPAERKPLKVQLTVRIKDGRLIFDLTGSDEQATGGVSAPISMTESALFIATKAIFPEIPVNQGVRDAIEIVAPAGSIVNCQFPTPVVGCQSGAYQKIVNCVFGCFSQIVPERVIAASPSLINMVLGGVDTRADSPLRGEPYVMYCWTEGGYGARFNADNGTFIALYASGTRNQPVEMFEQQFPLIWEKYELCTDSGGPGQQRGGLGVDRVLRMTGETGSASVMGDGEKHAPWGVFGGHAGRTNRLVRNLGADDEFNIGMFRSGAQITKGDRIDLRSGGGGGYGDPLARDPAAVLEDVIDGYVSIEGACRDYGVVIRERDWEALDYELDLDATRRARLAAAAADAARTIAR
jgi:N-methylhydantoinase B